MRTGTQQENPVTALRFGNGPGIAEEDLPHVFERFRQADAGPARQQGGLGIGLALVRQLTELHGGRVCAFSEGEGKGAMMTPGERKKWTPYHPYTLEENEEGEPTGEITFHFKQNATIRLKDGTEKALTIGVYDHNSKELFKPVFGGSEARVRYSFRQIAMTSLKEVGTRLDFAMVQVRKLAKGNAQKGFGKVEGYEESEDMAEGAAGSPASEEY